jgi:hypothetical protein
MDVMIRKILVCALPIACSITLLADSLAANDKDVALVLKTAGDVELNAPGRTTWVKARRGHRLHSGIKVKTGDDALAALVFTDDKSLLRVRENSNITIQGKREETGIVKTLSLTFGQIWAKVTKQNVSMRVETPSGVATVKGTEFNALFVNGVFVIYCQEGLMELVNQFGTLLLGANEMARLLQDAPPQRIQGDPNDIFDLSDEDDSESIEVEFEDANGNKKTLILEF